MTNTRGAAQWGRVTDFLIGHIVTDQGEMLMFPLDKPCNELAQQSEYWFDGYTDPDFYNYQARGRK